MVMLATTRTWWWLVVSLTTTATLLSDCPCSATTRTWWWLDLRCMFNNHCDPIIWLSVFSNHPDMMWIGFVATGGWLIIIPAIILGIFFGDEHPWRLVSILNSVAYFGSLFFPAILTFLSPKCFSLTFGFCVFLICKIAYFNSGSICT